MDGAAAFDDLMRAAERLRAVQLRSTLFTQWDVVVVTAETLGQAQVYQAELERRRRLGTLAGVSEHTLMVAVPDANSEQPVGSGGATLNALLVVAEQLSARSGSGTLKANIFAERHIVVMHAASSFRVPACNALGKAFSPLPLGEASAASEHGGVPLSNIDLVMSSLEIWCAGAPPGVWVCSTEFFLDVARTAPSEVRMLMLMLQCGGAVGREGAGGGGPAAPADLASFLVLGALREAQRHHGRGAARPAGAGAQAWRLRGLVRAGRGAAHGRRVGGSLLFTPQVIPAAHPCGTPSTGESATVGALHNRSAPQEVLQRCALLDGRVLVVSPIVAFDPPVHNALHSSSNLCYYR